MNDNVQTPVSSLGEQIEYIGRNLPEDVRAEYYRVMTYCRDLPESDEMLRILKILNILTLMMV